MTIPARVGERQTASTVGTSWAAALFEAAFLLIFPVVSVAAFHLSLHNQAGELDPYFYTGYIHNLPDLVARYGFPYYSVRFGLILPARWLGLIFGFDAGYLIFRYILALIAGVPVYLFVRKLIGRPVALAMYCALLTAPFLTRSLFWDHPDAAGVPYLLGAVGLFVLESGAAWDVVAGCLFGLAVHSNFFTVSVAGLFFATYSTAALISRRELRKLVFRIGCAAAGGTLVTAAGILYYGLALGLWNIFFPTLQVSRWLSNGGMHDWRTPGIAWIADSYHVLVLPIVAVYSVIAARIRPKRLEVLALELYVVAVALFFYLYQFAFKADILQLPYYFAYSFPAIFFGIVVIVAQLSAKPTQSESAAIAAAVLVGFLGPWLVEIYGKNWLALVNLRQFIEVSVVTASALAAGIFIRASSVLKHGVVWSATVAIGVFLAFGASDVSYSSIFTNHSPIESDLYQVAEQFVRAMPTERERPGRGCFWYTNRPGSLLNSVQSTYLWGLSRCSSPVDTSGGMPVIDESAAKRWQDPDIKYIVLLGESEEQRVKALAALTAAGVRFEQVKSQTLSSGTLSVYFTYLKIVRL